MTGMERNADVVQMASYAPLFGHVDAWQWTPNLIWVDNHRIYGTPNYYVQKLFSRNRGDVVLPVASADADKNKLFVSAVRENESGDVILKIVNALPESVPAEIHLQNIGNGARYAQTTVLTSGNLSDENSLDQPEKVAPVTTRLGKVGPKLQYALKPNSLTVLRISSSEEIRRAYRSLRAQ